MMGVYEIRNIINNKVYIGSSNDIQRRWNEHVRNLNNNTHHSYKLQKDWDEFGEGVFIFNIIELVDEENLLKDREQYYIDYFDSCNNGYNVSAIADRPDKNYLFDKEKGYLFKNKSYYIQFFKTEDNISDKVSDFADIGRLHVLAENTYADTNMIAYYKNKKYYPAGIKEISEIIRLCERNTKDFVKRMIDLGIMAKAIVNSNEQIDVQYYLNPLYFLSSKYLSPGLYMLFRKQLDEHLPQWVINKFNEYINTIK
jgi:group I intron endonuclease